VTDAIGTIGFIGGTGPHGRGIALRLRESGHRVLLGSRDAARAQEVVAELPAPISMTTGGIVGVDNVTAARQGDLVIVTTPWDGFEAVGAAHAPDLAGKVVISCANPLRFEGGGPMPVRLEDGSAAELLQRVCPDARVVSGFQNVSAVKLGRLGQPVEGDVLLCGDDEDAIALASDVVRAVEGLRPLHAGPLRLSSVAEDLTALLISVNRRYRTHASIALTGVDTGAAGGEG
jgi:8-hydroxy-5-deazaflavin:NADPH oxidoreductase